MLNQQLNVLEFAMIRIFFFLIYYSKVMQTKLGELMENIIFTLDCELVIHHAYFQSILSIESLISKKKLDF